jgi:hypothetical protein
LARLTTAFSYLLLAEFVATLVGGVVYWLTDVAWLGVALEVNGFAFAVFALMGIGLDYLARRSRG